MDHPRVARLLDVYQASLPCQSLRSSVGSSRQWQVTSPVPLARLWEGRRSNEPGDGMHGRPPAGSGMAWVRFASLPAPAGGELFSRVMDREVLPFESNMHTMSEGKGGKSDKPPRGLPRTRRSTHRLADAPGAAFRLKFSHQRHLLLESACDQELHSQPWDRPPGCSASSCKCRRSSGMLALQSATVQLKIALLPRCPGIKLRTEAT